MLAFEKVISSNAVRPSGDIFSKAPGRLATGSWKRNAMRFAAFGFNSTRSTRLAAASSLGVKANEAKLMVAITVVGVLGGIVGITGEIGPVIFRNCSRT